MKLKRARRLEGVMMIQDYIQRGRHHHISVHRAAKDGDIMDAGVISHKC